MRLIRVRAGHRRCYPNLGIFYHFIFMPWLMSRSLPKLALRNTHLNWVIWRFETLASKITTFDRKSNLLANNTVNIGVQPEVLCNIHNCFAGPGIRLPTCVETRLYPRLLLSWFTHMFTFMFDLYTLHFHLIYCSIIKGRLASDKHVCLCAEPPKQI